MGGSIAVDSIPGRGSTFTVQLALARCDGPSGKVPLCSEADSLFGRRILIIDDHAATREAMQRILREGGVVVEEAADLAGASLLIGTGQRYDAAILDIGLLGSDAASLSQVAARAPALAGIPLVLALPLSSKERASAAAGFAASVSKPVRAAQLRAAVVRVLSRPAAAPAPAAVAAAGAGLRVLVVDDSPINCRVALGMLGRMACQCDTATNGQEALDALAKADYDLVLLDCQMPVMDGYTAVAELRRREGTGRRTRVIALTADATQGARERCLAAGMDDYLVKPVQYESLATAVRRTPATSAKGAPPAPAPAPEPLELDRELLDQVRILGDEGFRSVIDRYIDQGPLRLATLAEAIAAGDVRKVGSIAHQIVGESGLVGLRRVEAIARGIELAARGQGGQMAEHLDPLGAAFSRGAELLRGVRDAVPAKA
jgi:CheY-like chemotaxis protein